MTEQLRNMYERLNNARQRWWGVMTLVLLLATNSLGQVATSYTFSQSAGTFSAITGGTQLENTTFVVIFDVGAFDNNVSAAQTIPAFNFNGTVYTQMYVSNNGFITFGSAPTGTNFTPLSSAEGYAGAISAVGCDLHNTTNGITGTRDVRWQTVGNEVIVQWRGVRRKSVGSEGFAFQIRLNTSTNEIKIVYGPFVQGPGTNTAIIPEVGLRGPNNTFATQVNNRLVGSGAETWATSLPGTANNSNMRLTSTAPAKSWTSGQTYTFTPCTPTVGVSPTSASICTGSNAALSASGASTYAWAPATGLSGTTGSSVTANPSSTTTYTVTGSNAGCAFTGTATTTITAVPGQTVPVMTPTSATTCAGSPQGLAASATTTATLSPSFSSSGGPATITTGAAQNASVYPWNLTTSGMPTSGVTVTSVTINGITHTFPDDLDILLQSPTGTNVILMSDVGGSNALTAVNYTFATGSPAMSDAGANATGTYAPTNITTPDDWPTAPGPGNGFSQASPTLTSFTGNLNGVWKLLIRDDANGDGGSITSWSITFTYNATVSYTWSPNVALSSTTGASVTASPTSTQTYTVSASNNANACTRTNSVTITVNPLPTATASGGGTICADQALPNVTFTFTGTPPYNFTYSGPGGTSVPGHNSNTYTITGAAAGTYAVTALSDANTCVGTNFGTSATVTVNPLPVVTCGTYGPVCIDAADITLGGSPAGGTWSGTGVTGNSFDPSVGTQTLTYSYTDGNGCSANCNTTITVNPLPVVTCGTYGPVCVDAADITLGGSPAGGTWSGTGVTGNSFDPSVGTQTVQYDYTDGNGCSASCSTTITVNPLPVVTCGTYGPVCVDAADITLSGSPAGGTWSGTGVTGNSFDPSVGTQTVQYDYTDGNGCSASCTTTITVNPLPVVTCPADITDICSVDAAFTLTGGSPAGGTYSGPGVSGGNFDPAVAGAGTHTISYSYTDGNGCSSSCTFTIDVTAATTWYGDLVDGDGLGDPAVALDACTQPVGYVANSDDACPTENGTIGSSCDDGNCFTTGDVLDGDCICTGTLVACDNWTLTIDAGTNGGQISWQIVEDGGPCVLASGSGYSNGSTNNVNVCVPQGNCFNLTFNDSGNNGITGGGWKLTDNFGRRILDNVGNGGCFTSTTTTALAFCNEPSSAQTVIPIHCDKENWIITDVIIASADAAVSAQYGIGDQTDDGYQFWFQSTCGTYSRRIFRNHATSGGQGPANAVRATKLALNSMVTNPLPVGELLNVRVRNRVNGVNGNWGPACRFKLDPNACTITQLNSTVSSPNYSCGVSGKVVGAGGNTGKIFADVVTSGGNPATHYRFQFAVPGEGYLRNAVSTNAACQLAVWQTSPLLCGTYTYEVRVQASFNGGTSYCPLGPVCNVTITNNQPVYCTPTGGAMQQQADTRSDNFDGGDFAMYPNPNRGDQLFVNMSGFDTTVGIVTVEMYDGFGKRVMTATLPVQDGFLNTALELSPDMAVGLYMVNVTAGSTTRTERLVIQR